MEGLGERMSRAAPSTRLLRHTPGTTAALGQNPAHRFANQHALVHYASEAVFTFIPKNACTSLRVSLAVANGAIATVDDWTWVHKNNGTFSATLSELARAPTTAVMLRCPFRRLASAFLDKIVSRSGELWTLRSKSRDAIDPDRLTFRAFVDWLAKPGYLRADQHWRPQVDFLVYDRYDHVFSMADLVSFADHFESVTGQPFVDARGLSCHTTSAMDRLEGACHADTPLVDLLVAKSRGALPDARTLYDEAIAARVAHLYEEDLALHRDLLGQAALLFPEFIDKEPVA